MQSNNLFLPITYGCQMNSYDTEKTSHILEEAIGFKRTDDIEQASLVIYNTCSIREKAQEKLFSDIGRLKKVRRKNDIMIAVGGCVASQEGHEIIKRCPMVDIVFGPQTLHRLPALITAFQQTGKPQVDISFPLIEKFDHMPKPRRQSYSAYVSIMEGCSKYCSYCVVPYTRGTEISRPFDDVLAEILTLSEQGVREIVLLGQNVNDYRGKMHQGGYANLSLLIHYIAAIEEIARIRFTTSHPKAFTDDLIDAYAQEPKLVNQLHLPVQSGSNKILTLMKRGYDREMFIEKIAKLREVRPDISVTSDFIVGFPGETENDFLDTLSLVEEINFDQSYSFIFSARPGTPAASMSDPTPLSEKKDRLARLQGLLKKQTLEVSHDMKGTVQTILVDGHSKKSSSELSGRTENNRVVNLPCPIDKLGKMVDVTITEALPNSLRARLNEENS